MYGAQYGEYAYWCQTFTSHEWLRQNFSLQYQYNIKQIGDENKEKFQFKNN